LRNLHLKAFRKSLISFFSKTFSFLLANFFTSVPDPLLFCPPRFRGNVFFSSSLPFLI
jgi:hypothetical protein